MDRFICHLNTEVIFGAGTIELLGEVAGRYGSNALIAIDPYLKNSELDNEIDSLLSQNSIERVPFSGIHPNPICFEVDEGAELARGRKCDVVIAIGGGSTIDSAKAIAFLAQNAGKAWDYIEGKVPPPRGALPLIAVPTTAGTGSEVTLYSVIANPETKDKRDFAYDFIIPKVALIDPQLMVSMPPDLTAATGIDALSHSLESFISSTATPYSRLVAKESIRLIARYLPEAVANGKNLEARSRMAWASTLGGLAILHARTTIPHALGTAASALFNVPHGAAIAACLAEVVQYSFMGNFEVFAELAEIFDESLKPLPLQTKAEKCGALVERLFQNMNYRVRFGDFGIQEADIDKLVEWLMKSGYWNDFKTHPRLFTLEDVKKVYTECL